MRFNKFNKIHTQTMVCEISPYGTVGTGKII